MLYRKNLWLNLFLISLLLSIFVFQIIPQICFKSYCHPLYDCEYNIKNLGMGLEEYCCAHNGGRLPSASGRQDYFYWTKGITHEFFQDLNILYCPWDEAKKDPSSYISDPRLAGRKISDLKKIPHLVILREREYRHQGHRAAFYGSDLKKPYRKSELPADIKYNLDLPEREDREVPDIKKISRQRELLWIFGLICLFLCPLLTIIFYILWAYSRHLNLKAFRNSTPKA